MQRLLDNGTEREIKMKKRGNEKSVWSKKEN